MGLTTFLKGFDGLSLTFSLAYLSAYTGHFLTKRHVGDIQEVQKRVLYGKAESLNGSELIDFINAIVQEDSKIFIPAKKGNRILFTISIAFFVVAFCSTFYTGLSQIFFKAFTEREIAFINDVVYIVFFALLALAVLLLIFEYLYWIDFSRFKTEYPSRVSKSIKVVCEEGKSHNSVRREESRYDPAKIKRVLTIYDSIKSFIVAIQQNGTADNELLTKLLQETKHANVLFKEPKIAKHIDTLYRRGVQLERVEKAISKAERSEMDRLVEKSEELFKWFCEQHKIVEDLFRPYLSK